MFPEALWIPSVMRLQALLQQALAWPLQRPTSKQKGFVSSFLYLVSIDYSQVNAYIYIALFNPSAEKSVSSRLEVSLTMPIKLNIMSVRRPSLSIK
jgi:hypothetical protein